MTKTEMINEILKNIKWTERSKEYYRKKATSIKKERIEELYNSYIKDTQNALFYACLL